MPDKNCSKCGGSGNKSLGIVPFVLCDCSKPCDKSPQSQTQALTEVIPVRISEWDWTQGAPMYIWAPKYDKGGGVFYYANPASGRVLLSSKEVMSSDYVKEGDFWWGATSFESEEKRAEFVYEPHKFRADRKDNVFRLTKGELVPGT